MKRTFELKPNRDLLDPAFPGYKISLNPLPVYERELKTGVDLVRAGDNQYSYAHVKIFALHNYLYSNPYEPDLFYYVDEKWNIVEISIGFMNRVQEMTNVLEIPSSRPRISGSFPVSLSFSSSTQVVINDGLGTFHVATVQKGKWIIVHSGSNNSESSVVSSSMSVENKLYILNRSIEDPEFHTILELLVLDDLWQTVETKKIRVSSIVDFVTIQSPTSILIISQTEPTCWKDKNEKTSEECLYKWSQTSEEVTLIFEKVEAEKTDISVNIEDGHIRVSIKGKEIVSGELYKSVRDSTWTLEKGILEVTLQKVEENVGWREFVYGDTHGIQTQTYQEQIEEDPPFNTEELEEVDAVAPASLYLYKVDIEKVTQEVDLTYSQYLFSTIIEPSKPPAVCLRTPIDGCIWQFEEDKDQNWKHKHIGTFSAFGYVQASKTQRKFLSAPSSLSYAVICDAFRHIYILRQPSPLDSSLRNRTSGERISQVSKQHLINLETNDEIVGIQTTRDLVMVLTTTKFFIIAIDE